jgi:hypothetical protein
MQKKRVNENIFFSKNNLKYFSMFFLAVLLISEFIVTLSILRFLLYSIVS